MITTEIVVDYEKLKSLYVDYLRTIFPSLENFTDKFVKEFIGFNEDNIVFDININHKLSINELLDQSSYKRVYVLEKDLKDLDLRRMK